jgi:ABC-type bacteriocin/lantibiotic exporter with double-glycine peptidase domain
LVYVGGFTLNAFGGYLVIGKNLSLGTLVAYGAVGVFLSAPVAALAREFAVLGDSLVRLKRIREILDLPTEDTTRVGTLGAAPKIRDLSFKNVCFAYGDKTVLHDVSFNISAGEAVALVGPSGAGKTTAAYIMLRLFEPDSGAILLNGEDVRKFSLGSYRDYFSLVPQDTLLQNTTVQENLALGNVAASLSDMEDACRVAQIHDFIKKLPAGYESTVGQAGMHFSGGERQRLAIARALLRRPPVLIMDEPTSFLDSDTERRLIGDLRDFLGTATTLLLITHRPAVAQAMDRILMAKDGSINEEVALRRVEKSVLIGGHPARCC